MIGSREYYKDELERAKKELQEKRDDEKVLTFGIYMLSVVGVIATVILTNRPDPYPELARVNYAVSTPVRKAAKSAFYNKDCPSSYAEGDLDGDGLSDILTVDNYGNVFLRKNLGNGDYAGVDRPLVKVPVDSKGCSILGIRDVDGDGLEDIIYTVPADGSVYAAKNLGNLRFE